MYPSVAELVKKYQDYLPPQGVEDLTKTALAPGVPVSESEQEGAPLFRPRPRHKTRQHQQTFLSKRSSVSDFESSYAANIAPKYLAKRNLGQSGVGSRIPIGNYPDSRTTSRRTSPDKRPSFSRTNTDSTLRVGRTSPPPGKNTLTPGMKPRSKPVIRLGPKDKLPPARPSSVVNPKSTFRRAPAPGSKVSNIAKHFERMNRENERASRRYAVIRGKRARPVASARAKVEVLESIKDAIKDEESESSDSSEADDEGGGEDDDNVDQKSPQKSPQTIPETPPPAPAVLLEPADDQPADTPARESSVRTESVEAVPSGTVTSPHEIEMPPSLMSSPMLSPTAAHGMMPMTPPPTDIDIEPSGRPSILKALSTLWPQQAPSRGRSEVDPDDPMADPEHIFRDSSMVVRTDEPTSIIALALK